MMGMRARILAGLLFGAAPGLAMAGDCGTTFVTSCPDNITIEGCRQPGGQIGAFVNYDMPTAQDDCGPVTMYPEQGPPPGGFFPEGATDVLWITPPDANGSQRICQFTVFVIWDPHLTYCPADTFVEACRQEGGFVGAVVDYPLPAVEDDCGPVPMTLFDGFPPGSLFPVGETEVRWETQGSLYGQPIVCSFRVHVHYQPTITCPPDTTITVCPQAFGADYTYDLPTASDACGPVDVFQTEGPLPGEDFPVGVTRVTWSTDPFGNAPPAECSFYVRVDATDHEPPVVLDCPSDTVIIAEPGETGARFEYSVHSIDNCSQTTTLCQPGSGAFFPCGTTPVVCSITDNTGNESICTFNVTVATPVAVDIRPGACPNPLKTSEQGVIPVAIAGTPLFDATTVDPSSVRLEGVAPVKWSIEDVTGPYEPLTGKTDCVDCARSKKDRRMDLSLKFDAQAIVAALGDVEQGECRVLHLTGALAGGCPIGGEDVVRIITDGGKLEPIASPVAPEAFALEANRPNPFGAETVIRFALPSEGRVTLTVYDLQGRVVKVLDDAVRSAESHDVTWDGTDESGRRMPNGIYFYRLNAASLDGSGETFTERHKMILNR